jgi:hypothetical protein
VQKLGEGFAQNRPRALVGELSAPCGQLHLTLERNTFLAEIFQLLILEFFNTIGRP